MSNNNKNAVIVGASSGIGESLIPELLQHGYNITICARRTERLNEICNQYKSSCKTISAETLDISDISTIKLTFERITKAMKKLDLVIISSGIGYANPDLDYELEEQTIQTNVNGFVAVANEAFKHFKQHGRGHLVGISSIMCLRGSAYAPAYSASKAFASNYMEGLRVKALKEKLDIIVTDVRPGYVDTKMARGDNLFWVSSTSKAAKQIMHAIDNRKSSVYVSKRWQLISWAMKTAPNFLYKYF